MIESSEKTQTEARQTEEMPAEQSRAAGKKAERGIHDGHRGRMLQIYLKNGADGFSDVQLLEFLLGYCLPRGDVNPLAHRLLDELGGLHKVFGAPIELLTRVKGVNPRTAAFLQIIPALWNRCEQSKICAEQTIRSVQDAGRYLLSKIGAYREERAFLMSLDGRRRLLDFRELTRGQVNSVNLPYRKLVEAALMANATSVILAHNHTCGPSLPSREDISYTQGAAELLKTLNIRLADHILVTGQNYFSMRLSGMLDDPGSAGTERY